MKYREAAIHVMNSIEDVEKVFGNLMTNLIACKEQNQLSDEEFILVTGSVLSTIQKLHNELGEVVVKEHPELAPCCHECFNAGIHNNDENVLEP